MRVITHCPACQTQFFATEEQLNQHGGKVRCGQCMQVFDARAQLIATTDDADQNASSVFIQQPPATYQEAPAPESPPHAAETATESQLSVSAENETETAQPSPSFISDSLTPHKKRIFKTRTYSTNIPGRWLWTVGIILLLIAAALQSIYFLRDKIAVHYPQLKPYLLQVCEQLSCSIDLPRNIEFIVIDDSDMQEDTEHAGVVRFSSTLINKGQHVVALPNLELTLTDTEDKPVLRRIFKPAEYAPAQSNPPVGIQAGEEIRLNLAMTTDNVAVAGYRVFVTY